jgi:integrase
MSQSIGFTDARLKKLKPQDTDVWVTDPRARRGEGRLVFRLRSDGRAEFYFRQRTNGKNQLLRIGRFQRSVGDGGLTVTEATEAFKKLSGQARGGDIKVIRDIERDEQRKKEAAQRHAAASGSLADLLTAYTDHLKSKGKASASKVQSDFERDVVEAFPTFAAKPAHAIAPMDVQKILARLVKRGATRSVNKLRSNLGAAFNFGIGHELSPLRLAAGRTHFSLTSNPALVVARVAEFDRARSRVLSEPELKQFWQALDKVTPIHAATLRLAILLGGQRIEQLLRANWSDYDTPAGTIRLSDSKGKGATRVHIVPVLPRAQAELELLRSINGVDESPFTVDGRFGSGRVRLRMDSLSCTVADMVKAMKGEHFTMRDLRRTCETMLAMLGVDRETRAQLLSHGRTSGVQGKHYDQHSYLHEKERALRTWHAKLNEILTGEASPKVVKLR